MAPWVNNWPAVQKPQVVLMHSSELCSNNPFSGVSLLPLCLILKLSEYPDTCLIILKNRNKQLEDALLDGLASAYNAGDLGSIPGSDPWVGKIPWRRKWQPAPVFLPGKSHGLRILVSYSPWAHKESDRIEWLHFLFYHQTEAL